MNTKRTSYLVIAALLLGGTAGMIVGANHPAGVTVMPCAAWANTSHPDLPANTFKDACITPDGSLSLPDGTTVK